MSKAAWVDMLTLHAMGWNHKKSLSLHQSLSTRYVKRHQIHLMPVKAPHTEDFSSQLRGFTLV
ncbi:hypothetical protein PGIGA_G00184420 [Pangasianodon gigas]|uniref:Uncharacterized protein n=1 Tax=Pangasianodon gigas TaxID=30993 RepID=A0ACC5WAU6_PANGG|nr:hypothetical protein [Pangasianodon gigas]